jgi:hypothetical protein
MKNNNQPQSQGEYEVWPEYDEQAVHQVHTFCDDLLCPCHEDQEAIEQTAQDFTDGLMSIEDADRYYRGKTV